MRSRFEAVIFDTDHTLIDPTRFIEDAVLFSLGSLGLTGFNRERWNITNGKHLKTRYLALLEDHDLPESILLELVQMHKEFQKENTHLVSAYEDAIPTLKSLRADGIKLAAISNRPRSTLIPTLQHTKLLGLLDVVVAGDDVENPKPDPEPILRALGFLNVNPKNALMVGDTKEDMMAGIKAEVIPILIQRDSRFLKQLPSFNTINSLRSVLPISRFFTYL